MRDLLKMLSRRRLGLHVLDIYIYESIPLSSRSCEMCTHQGSIQYALGFGLMIDWSCHGCAESERPFLGRFVRDYYVVDGSKFYPVLVGRRRLDVSSVV